MMRFSLYASTALLSILAACASPTESELVPTPEAVLWRQPLTLGDAQGEVGDRVLFQTPLRIINSRGATIPGATVTMLDGATGATRWQLSSDSILAATVPLTGGSGDVYVTMNTGATSMSRISVLDAATGRTRWQAPGCGLTPARVGDAVILLEATPTTTSASVFVGHDADTGAERWRVDLTSEKVDCGWSRLLAIRGDTAVYLVNVFGSTAPFTPGLRFLRVTSSGGYRFVNGPSSLAGRYAGTQLTVDARMLGNQPVVLLRDSTRFHAVNISDGTLLWTRDPQPLDVRQRAYDPQGYRVVSSSPDIVTVASTDSLGYPIWRATLDTRTGASVSEVRPTRDDITPLGTCGAARVLASDTQRRLLLLDGATQTIARRLDVTFGAAGESFVRPNSVTARASSYSGRYGFVADLTLPYETSSWLAFRCD